MFEGLIHAFNGVSYNEIWFTFILTLISAIFSALTQGLTGNTTA